VAQDLQRQDGRELAELERQQLQEPALEVCVPDGKQLCRTTGMGQRPCVTARAANLAARLPFQ